MTVKSPCVFNAASFKIHGKKRGRSLIFWFLFLCVYRGRIYCEGSSDSPPSSAKHSLRGQNVAICDRIDGEKKNHRTSFMYIPPSA